MWTLIGLATARHQLRVAGISIARVAVRAPAHSGAVLRRGFAESKRRSTVAADAVSKPKATRTRKTPSAAAAAKPKKKPVAKKVKAKAKAKKVLVKKAKKPKKVPTVEEKRAALIQHYKAISLLREQPAKLPQSPRHLYMSEKLKGQPDVNSKMIELAGEYKQLPASELERLQAHAARNKLANEAAQKSWIQKHTPSEIVAANFARARLNSLEVYKKHLSSLQDDRIPKRPSNAYQLYLVSRFRTADITTSEGSEQVFKDIAVAWRALSDSERQPFIDNAAVDQARYHEEVQKVLGRGVQTKTEA